MMKKIALHNNAQPRESTNMKTHESEDPSSENRPINWTSIRDMDNIFPLD